MEWEVLLFRIVRKSNLSDTLKFTIQRIGVFIFLCHIFLLSRFTPLTVFQYIHREFQDWNVSETWMKINKLLLLFLGLWLIINYKLIIYPLTKIVMHVCVFHNNLKQWIVLMTYLSFPSNGFFGHMRDVNRRLKSTFILTPIIYVNGTAFTGALSYNSIRRSELCYR
jgi:hypothetical protein